MIQDILLVLLEMLVLFVLALFCIDGYFYLVNRYCRFHIGRWKNLQDWSGAVHSVAAKWAKRTPTVKITDNSRYILLDILNGRYRSHSIQSWQNAATILGLWEKGDIEKARKSASKFVRSDGNWVTHPVAVDSSMLAYAILKVSADPLSVKPAMDEMIALVERQKDTQELIAYTGGKNNPERYVDTIGLVCPFLSLYANVYSKPEYSQMAYDQIKFYHDHGLLSGTCLPNHAINVNTKLPLGVYGWGRGTVWYALGLIDTFAEMADGAIKTDISRWIVEAAESYRCFQRPDGGFGSILQRLDTYDSSATAGLAYFYASCAERMEHPEYYQIAYYCFEKLRSVTRITGKIDWCQGDTKGIGIFAQTYDVMPFAQGLALRAIAIDERKTAHDQSLQN